ncbi:MAG: ATP-dependent helicase [Sandaracinaceae bacterium]
MNIDPVDPGLAGLNPPQREAVLHQGGPLVVFAGAGSGKTRVITHRVAHLVTEHGAAPWNILAVTFTNKAAQEMRDRLGKLIGPPARDLWVGTFHAVCSRLLRRYADLAGVRKDFTIYDQQDSQAMVKRVLKDLDFDNKRHDPKQITGRIARAKQEMKAPDQVEVDNPFDIAFKDIYAAYDKRMMASGALDFADLLYRLVVAMEAKEELRVELGKRFRYLLVDEFQDTNHVQFRFVRSIALQHQQVMVVGDDDQSIYRWRGADRRNILSFREYFPETRVIKLEQNYRSTARILRAANAVIQKATHREPKELWTDNEEGAQITGITCANERREAELLVEAVRQLRVAGRSLDEIALFYRVHAQSRVFEEELRRSNVPYRVVGGMRFYDRAEVKDMLAYLRVLANPDDDVSLLRIINTPTRGIGKKSIEGLLNRAARDGTGAWIALEKAAAGSGGPAKRFSAFLGLMHELRRELSGGAPLAAVAYEVYEKTGYKAWLKEQDTPEADARMQNIEELLGAIQVEQESDPDLTLQQFLEQVTLDTNQDEDASEQRLTLMTVHAAKGLEFPVVLVAGLEENTFPFKRQNQGLDEEALGEERRLAYVALTRAEERLILSWAVERRLFRDRFEMQPSRFLTEIPKEDVTEVVDDRVRGWGGSRRSMRGSTSSPKPVRPPPRRAPPRGRPPGGPPRDLTPGDSYIDRSEGDGFAIEVGMDVSHRKFGRGRIIQIKPTSPPRVDVRFASGSVKTIRIDFLQPA